MTCPNKNTKEYKQLEERVGSVVAHSLFNKFDEDYDAINKHLDELIPKPELSRDMKALFGDKTTITIKEALDYIAEQSTTKVSQALAKRLLRNLSNDTTVELMSAADMQKNIHHPD